VTALRRTKRTVYDCRCERCGHSWLALKLPTACASCKSRSWNVKPGGAHFLLPRPVASYLRELAAHSGRTEWKGQWFGGACPDCHHATVHDSLGCTDKGPPFGSPCRCARKGPGKIPLDKTLPK
jgi:hypothetical protein